MEPKVRALGGSQRERTTHSCSVFWPISTTQGSTQARHLFDDFNIIKCKFPAGRELGGDTLPRGHKE